MMDDDDSAQTPYTSVTTSSKAKLKRREVTKRPTKTSPEDKEWMYYLPAEIDPKRLAPPKSPLSQIPGMGRGEGSSMLPSLTPKSSIVPTDSAYIRLAKEGGRRDLLDYEEPRRPEASCPKAYPWPDWMRETPEADSRPAPPDPRHPSWAEHHETPDWSSRLTDPAELAVTFKPKPPFSLQDRFHQWQRDGGDPVPSEISAKRRQRGQQQQPVPVATGRSRRSSNMPTAKHRRATQQSGKDSKPIDMNHLMSMGYQKDWVEVRQEELVQQQARERAEAQQKKKLLNHSVDAGSHRQRQRSQASSNAEQPQFKLSKFSNVPSKVSTWRESDLNSSGQALAGSGFSQ